MIWAFRIRIKERHDIGRTTLKWSASACRSAKLIVLALAPKFYALAAFSCSLVSFSAPPHGLLKFESLGNETKILTLNEIRPQYCWQRQVS